MLATSPHQASMLAEPDSASQTDHMQPAENIGATPTVPSSRTFTATPASRVFTTTPASGRLGPSPALSAGEGVPEVVNPMDLEPLQSEEEGEEEEEEPQLATPRMQDIQGYVDVETDMDTVVEEPR